MIWKHAALLHSTDEPPAIWRSQSAVYGAGQISWQIDGWQEVLAKQI